MTAMFVKSYWDIQISVRADPERADVMYKLRKQSQICYFCVANIRIITEVLDKSLQYDYNH